MAQDIFSDTVIAACVFSPYLRRKWNQCWLIIPYIILYKSYVNCRVICLSYSIKRNRHYRTDLMNMWVPWIFGCLKIGRIRRCSWFHLHTWPENKKTCPVKLCIFLDRQFETAFKTDCGEKTNKSLRQCILSGKPSDHTHGQMCIGWRTNLTC